MSQRGRLSRDGREQDRRPIQIGHQTNASGECSRCVRASYPPFLILQTRLWRLADSKTNSDCTPLVSTIGLLFQILDDHLNLSPTSELQTLKGLCEDLTEGKFSFPVIHAIRTDPSNQILINILKQKTTDDEVKKYACRYMQSKGSFEYSASVIEDLRGKVEQQITAIEARLESGTEGAEALRAMLARLVLR